VSSDNNSARDEQWPFLSPEHAKLLQDSGISPDIARERGLGFGEHRARALRWLTAHDLKLADRLFGPGTAAENLSASRTK
jgi:hypothetical protein